MFFVMQVIVSLPNGSVRVLALIAERVGSKIAIIQWNTTEQTDLDFSGLELKFAASAGPPAITIVDSEGTVVARARHAEPSYAFLRTRNRRSAEATYRQFIDGTFYMESAESTAGSP